MDYKIFITLINLEKTTNLCIYIGTGIHKKNGSITSWSLELWLAKLSWLSNGDIFEFEWPATKCIHNSIQSIIAPRYSQWPYKITGSDVYNNISPLPTTMYLTFQRKLFCLSLIGIIDDKSLSMADPSFYATVSISFNITIFFFLQK